MKNLKTKPVKIDLENVAKKRIRALFSMIVALMLVAIALVPVSAADTAAAPSGGDTDPLSILTNFTSFVFSVVQAVGVLMFIFGFVQFGLAWMNHDPSQRAQALMILVGGLFFFCAKYIINLIAPGTV